MTHDAKTLNTLPIYGEKPAFPGMYLGLLHGRDDPKQKMDGWGFHGPMIGPLQWFHTTYACTIRIAFELESDALRYFDIPGIEHELELTSDMLAYGGKFYGDWTVYAVNPQDCELPVDTFRRNQRCAGHWAHSACLR